MARTRKLPEFAALLQEYFTVRLIAQRNASPATVAGYRDTFRLLLTYAHEQLHRQPTELGISDLDAPLVTGFLSHLEHQRGNCPRTRNARLAAIRSFLHFAVLKCPTALASIQRVLAIPMKRFNRRVLDFLTREEMTAILDAPTLSTWTGRRDHAMLATFYNTGARISEIADARVTDLASDRRQCLRIHGKGRKERVVPLWRSTCRLLSSWSQEISTDSNTPLFPTRSGGRLSRSAIENRIDKAVNAAAAHLPELRQKRVSPHTFRHTTAMHLLQSGVDMTVIALWLGHESPTTTHMYVEADLAMKRKALDKLLQPHFREKRLTPSDRLLAFLDGL
jgi:integrase/recombinase XerD